MLGGGGPGMRQHQAVQALKERPVPPKLCWDLVPKSHERKAPSESLREASARRTVVEAPQLLQRQRVLPALVLPFLTSLLLDTPQTG